MAKPGYERLSALDASMVFMETERTHMHVGEVGILDAGPLTGSSGVLDMERIRSHVAGALRLVPRHRQRLAFIPVEGHPVWVDDAQFNLDDHVFYVTLPPPGSMEQLKALVGRIMSQKLDLSRPLWEMWFVDGLLGGRFAMVNKLHHCMVDGISAVGVLSAFFSPDRQAAPHRPSPWRPRRAPSAGELAVEELRRRARAPAALLRSVTAALSDAEGAASAFVDAIEGAAEAVVGKLYPASTTPLNLAEVGPRRRVEWIRFDLGDVKSVKNRLGGKVNDVVLAVVAGAMRRYLHVHRTPVRGLDFRVVVPVNTRSLAAAMELGNRVVPTLARLPLEAGDPRRRLHLVAETTRALKASKEIHFVELFEELANWGDAALLSEFVRRVTRWWAGNLIVTDIPGPQVPLYLLGARLLEGYPFVPMMSNQALCVALLSYAGGLYWGFNVDRDAITDVPTLARCFVDEFDDLRKAAGDGGAAASVRPRTTGPLAATATVAKRAHRASRRPPRKRSSSARSARN
jgi:WS/DGAT/MGAT family acyltransferase